MKTLLLLAVLLLPVSVQAQGCGPDTGVSKVTGWPITGGPNLRHLSGGRIAEPVFTAEAQGAMSKLLIARQIAGDCPTCTGDTSGLVAPALTERDRLALGRVRWHIYKPCPREKITVSPELYRALQSARPDVVASVRLDPSYTLPLPAAAPTARPLSVVVARQQQQQQKRVAAMVAAAHAPVRPFSGWGIAFCVALLVLGSGLLSHVQIQKRREKRLRSRLASQRAELRRRALVAALPPLSDTSAKD
jgi:hypothetical protein